MNCKLGQINWDDFATLLVEARGEPQEGTRPAKNALFAPVEKALRQWTYRHYGYDPWHFEVRRSDVIQQAYLRAWQSFDQFQGNTEKEFLAWLMKILSNELNQLFRKGQQEKKVLSRIDPTSYVKSARGGPNLLDEVIRREERRILLKAFEQLPEDCQRVLTFRHTDHLPYEEIGSRLNRSTEATRKLCQRARVMLLHFVRKEGGSQPR